MDLNTAREKLDDLQSFLTRIDDVSTNELGIGLLVARRIDDDQEDPDYEFGRIPVVQSIAGDLEELVREKVDTKVESLENNSLRFDSYSLENRDRDESFVQYEPVENIPQFEHFERLLNGQRFRHTTYTEEPKPEFQAIRLRDEENEEMAIAFINYSRRQIMGRTSRIRMKVGDETHTKVNDSLLSIPDRIDAIYHDDTMFVFDHSKFEKMFDYLEEYESRAEEVVDAIEEADIPFRDFQLFEDAVYGNNRVLRLMHKIHERGAYEEMSADDAEYIRENFDSDVKFEENENGEMEIVMDDKRDVWAVLRFFNDDHLDSPLTDEQYISLSKQDG